MKDVTVIWFSYWNVIALPIVVLLLMKNKEEEADLMKGQQLSTAISTATEI
jgi:hypothetical protein